MINLKEGEKIENIEFKKSGNTYMMRVPKKIFEFLKLKINKKYDIIIKEI